VKAHIGSAIKEHVVRGAFYLFPLVAISVIQLGLAHSQNPERISFPGATPTPTPACSWTDRASVPYNAGGIFAASDGTFVYCGGGWDGITVHADLLRYEPRLTSRKSTTRRPTVGATGRI
jgi:hypothetical protein